MNIKLYDAGKKYEGGDRYTVFFKIPPTQYRKNPSKSTLKLIENYKGVWCSAQPCGDEVLLLAEEWFEKGKYQSECFGRPVDLNTMPESYQKWCKKKENAWLAAWRVNTEEAWKRFWNK